MKPIYSIIFVIAFIIGVTYGLNFVALCGEAICNYSIYRVEWLASQFLNTLFWMGVCTSICYVLWNVKFTHRKAR